MRDSFNEINITPLTDIFLVLLIIMMVIAPMMDQQGLKLIVPQAVKEQSINKEFKTINFQVTTDGKYIIEDLQVNADELEDIIAQRVKSYPDGLLIMTEPDAEHGVVVKLMDAARSAGVSSISVQGL
ncbi:biopolymer transporter ExbD [bacterium]|nr:biopolymer transporter ExbD [bacterium]